MQTYLNSNALLLLTPQYLLLGVPRITYCLRCNHKFRCVFVVVIQSRLDHTAHHRSRMLSPWWFLLILMVWEPIAILSETFSCGGHRWLFAGWYFALALLWAWVHERKDEFVCWWYKIYSGLPSFSKCKMQGLFWFHGIAHVLRLHLLSEKQKRLPPHSVDQYSNIQLNQEDPCFHGT